MRTPLETDILVRKPIFICVLISILFVGNEISFILNLKSNWNLEYEYNLITIEIIQSQPDQLKTLDWRKHVDSNWNRLSSSLLLHFLNCIIVSFGLQNIFLPRFSGLDSTKQKICWKKTCPHNYGTLRWARCKIAQLKSLDCPSILLRVSARVFFEWNHL